MTSDDLTKIINKVDLIVIGAGPGGLAATNVAVELGVKVLLIDEGSTNNKYFSVKLNDSQLPLMQTGSAGGATNVWGWQVGAMFHDEFESWIDNTGGDRHFLNKFMLEQEAISKWLSINSHTSFRREKFLRNGVKLVQRRTGYILQSKFESQKFKTLNSDNVVFLDNTKVEKLIVNDGEVIGLYIFGSEIIPSSRKKFLIAAGTLRSTELILKSLVIESEIDLLNQESELGKNLVDHPSKYIGKVSKKRFSNGIKPFQIGFNKRYKSKNIIFRSLNSIHSISVNIELHEEKERKNSNNLFKDACSRMKEVAFRYVAYVPFIDTFLNFFQEKKYKIWIQFEQLNSLNSFLYIKNDQLESSYCLTSEDFETFRWALAVLKNNLKFIEEISILPEKDDSWQTFFDEGAHPSGTIRMHIDPKKATVDVNGICHRVKNLGVGSAAIFPTAGWVNPTWLIMAFARLTTKELIRSIDSEELN